MNNLQFNGMYGNRIIAGFFQAYDRVRPMVSNQAQLNMLDAIRDAILEKMIKDPDLLATANALVGPIAFPLMDNYAVLLSSIQTKKEPSFPPPPNPSSHRSGLRQMAGFGPHSDPKARGFGAFASLHAGGVFSKKALTVRVTIHLIGGADPTVLEDQLTEAINVRSLAGVSGITKVYYPVTEDVETMVNRNQATAFAADLLDNTQRIHIFVTPEPKDMDDTMLRILSLARAASGARLDNYFAIVSGSRMSDGLLTELNDLAVEKHLEAKPAEEASDAKVPEASSVKKSIEATQEVMTASHGGTAPAEAAPAEVEAEELIPAIDPAKVMTNFEEALGKFLIGYVTGCDVQERRVLQEVLSTKQSTEHWNNALGRAGLRLNLNTN